MNKVSKRYIKDIRLFLKLYGKTERTFLRKMKVLETLNSS